MDNYIHLARHCTLQTAVRIKQKLAATVPGFDSLAFAKAIRMTCRERAEARDAWRDAEYACFRKGHSYHIANGYQGLYDRGYDVPVTCTRCGNTEM